MDPARSSISASARRGRSGWAGREGCRYDERRWGFCVRLFHFDAVGAVGPSPMTPDNRKVFRHAILIALFVVLAGSESALAADRPQLPPGVTCSDIREKVAEHGRAAATA